jgi:hypothetical protein
MKRFALPCFKRKRGETSYEKLHVSKERGRKRMKSASCWEGFY